jgi:hypothetical protein
MTLPTTTTSGLTAGTRVTGDATTRSFGRTGTVTRVIDADGVLGGIVEVRWDGERRPSRSAGFEAVNALTSVDCGCPFKGRRHNHWDWCPLSATQRRNRSGR